MADLFADQSLYAALFGQAQSLPERAGPEDGLRAWVAGCGTGEDAYAAAILLHDVTARRGAAQPVTVFATDTRADLLARARAGEYPSPRLAQMAPAQRERFFFSIGGNEHVKAPIRERVLFAAHRLLDDPPFSRLDLIVCRDLFTALAPDQRAAAVRRFAFALRPGGLLLLGDPLPPEHERPCFRPAGGDYWLYARTNAPTLAPDLRASAPGPPGGHLSARSEGAPPPAHGTLPGLIVDAEGRIVHLGAGVEPFLHMRPGPPSHHIRDVIQPELREALRTTLGRARARLRAAESAPLPITIGGASRYVTLIVQPLPTAGPGGGGFAVLFDADDAPAPDSVRAERPSPDLPLALATLQAQHDIIYEELRVANEELQVANEELRTSTEELEVRGEELQSLNEQLQTVNDEQRRTLAALARANADLENLIAATEIGTLFLDRALRVQRYTAPVQQIVNLLPADLGRPLAHLTHQLRYDELLDDAAAILARPAPFQREARHADGRWFLVRLRPYRTATQDVSGVVLTFVDISERRQAEETLRRSHDDLERRVWERTAELTQAHAARQRLLRQLVQAQEAERLRIARELHDTVGQQITAVLLALQTARDLSEERVGTLAQLDQIRTIVQEMGRELHEIAVNLRPTGLDDVGLAGALRAYVEGWSRRTGVAAELLVTGVDRARTPPEVESTVYRVAQEALTNIVRHAAASRVSVVLEGGGSHIVAAIEDDGRGFDVDAASQAQRRGHLGLLGMQERVALVGGTLTLESAPGCGTTLIVRIPLAREAEVAYEPDSDRAGG